MATPNRTTYKQAADRIRASETIAIVVPDAPDIPVTCSAFAFAGALRAIGKTVSAFGPRMLPGTHTLPMPLGEDEPLREFVISFDVARSPVRELKYERAENRLDIILSPTSSRIRREDISFRLGALRYDLVITLGVESPETASASITKAPELLHEKPVLNIDSSDANREYGEMNLLSETSAGETLPEMIYELLQELGTMSAETATPLFAGLVAATRGFNLGNVRSKTFGIAEKLISAGADVHAAGSISSPERHFPSIQLGARALVRSRIDELSGILWAILTAEDFQKTGGTIDAAESVLKYIFETVPHMSSYFLLVQDPKNETVRSFGLFPNRNARSIFPELPENTPPESIHELPQQFRTFAEAEESIRKLLQSAPEVEME